MIVSLQTEQDQPEQPQPDPEQIIHAWFLDILKDHKDKAIADLLDITSSKVWKLKSGHQRLQAVELLKLHQSLDVPLPDIMMGSIPVEVKSIPARKPADPKQLFSFAYDHVNQLEDSKPEAERMDVFGRMEQVFHILRSVQDTPEAVDFKEL
jgi:transcriptional regulator with XRE-family HTH domain